MKIGAAFGKLLSGESVIRDFLTVGLNDQVREKVYLQTGDRVLDVSGNQWLLGLDPRVIGIWIEKKELAGMASGPSGYTLYIRDSAPAEKREADAAAPAGHGREGAVTIVSRLARQELLRSPSQWMPWNYRETMTRFATPAAA